MYKRSTYYRTRNHYTVLAGKIQYKRVTYNTRGQYTVLEGKNSESEEIFIYITKW